MPLRVLLVENDPDHLLIEQRAIASGFGPENPAVFESASSTFEIERVLAANRIDLAMIDVHLDFPLTGYDVADIMEEAGVPYVIVSSTSPFLQEIHNHPVLPKSGDVIRDWARQWVSRLTPPPLPVRA